MHSITLIGSVIATIVIVQGAPVNIARTSTSSISPSHLDPGDIQAGTYLAVPDASTPFETAVLRRKTAKTVAKEKGQKSASKTIKNFFKDEINDVKCDFEADTEACKNKTATDTEDSKNDKRAVPSSIADLALNLVPLGVDHGPVVNKLGSTVAPAAPGDANSGTGLFERSAISKTIGGLAKDVGKDAGTTAATNIGLGLLSDQLVGSTAQQPEQATSSDSVVQQRSFVSSLGKDAAKTAATQGLGGVIDDFASGEFESLLPGRDSVTEKRDPKFGFNSGSSSSSGSSSGSSTSSTTGDTPSTGGSTAQDIATKAGTSAAGSLLGDGISAGIESLISGSDSTGETATATTARKLKRSPKSTLGSSSSSSSSSSTGSTSSSDTSSDSSLGSKIATNVFGGLIGNGVSLGVESAIDGAAAPKTTPAVVAEKFRRDTAGSGGAGSPAVAIERSSSHKDAFSEAKVVPRQLSGVLSKLLRLGDTVSSGVDLVDEGTAPVGSTGSIAVIGDIQTRDE